MKKVRGSAGEGCRQLAWLWRLENKLLNSVIDLNFVAVVGFRANFEFAHVYAILWKACPLIYADYFRSIRLANLNLRYVTSLSTILRIALKIGLNRLSACFKSY